MEILKDIIRIIYPNRCPICDKVVLNKKICPECYKKIKFVGNSFCFKCGKSLRNPGIEFCDSCMHKRRYFNKGFSLMVYNNISKKSMYLFKYGNRREYAEFYIEEIIKRYGNILKKENVDTIIPVPLHKSKLRKRGYNQAEILAKELSKYLNVQVNNNILYRDKKTMPLKTLNEKERIENLKNAFSVNKLENLNIKKVILIDDIYTTGTTMNLCCELLRKVGIKNIIIISVCSGN